MRQCVSTACLASLAHGEIRSVMSMVLQTVELEYDMLFGLIIVCNSINANINGKACLYYLYSLWGCHSVKHRSQYFALIYLRSDALPDTSSVIYSSTI